MQISVEVQVLQDTQILIQSELLRHVADAALDLLRVGRDVDAQDPQDASVNHHQPGDQTEERGLAGPVRSDQGCERPMADVERDTVERLDDVARVAVERLADIAAAEDRCMPCRRTHRCPSAVGTAGETRGFCGGATPPGTRSRVPTLPSTGAISCASASCCCSNASCASAACNRAAASAISSGRGPAMVRARAFWVATSRASASATSSGRGPATARARAFWVTTSLASATSQAALALSTSCWLTAPPTGRSRRGLRRSYCRRAFAASAFADSRIA